MSYTWFSQRWQQSHVLNVVGSEDTCPSMGEHFSECATDRSVKNTVPQKYTSIESFLLTVFPRTHFLLEMVCVCNSPWLYTKGSFAHTVCKVQTLAQYTAPSA